MELSYLWIALVVVFVFIVLKLGKSTPDKTDATEEDILLALKAGKKVTAIKYYRALHNVGLKEAKEAVEKIQAENSAHN